MCNGYFVGTELTKFTEFIVLGIRAGGYLGLGDIFEPRIGA